MEVVGPQQQGSSRSGAEVTSEAGPSTRKNQTASRNTAGTGGDTGLMDILSEHLLGPEDPKAQRDTRMNGGSSTEEDEANIQEIRETLDGTTLGVTPEPGPEEDVLMEEEPDEDYWSEAAIARRVALRRKVFHEGESDDDLDLHMDMDEDEPRTSDPSSSAILRPPTPPRRLSLVNSPSSPSSSTRIPSPPPRRPSTSSLTPKSILKPPAPRKKSVSFDDSVPLPPDSPGLRPVGNGHLGFPMPVTEVKNGGSGDFDPRPIPTIIEPKPPEKRTREAPFAGFKPGFLSQPNAQAKISSTASKGIDTAAPNSGKSSIFAQRRAAQQVAGSAALSTSKTLPKMPTTDAGSVKTAVIEKAPTHNDALARQQPSKSRFHEEDVDPDENDEDDDDFYDDDDEEDEYDLDDALIAREVALDHHRRQANRTLNRPLDDEDELDGMDTGGVVMALPEIKDGRILNPNPDELRKVVRVGRLENGNLVLAPGEADWSDEEEGEAKENRDRIRRQLLGEEPPVTVAPPVRSANPVSQVQVDDDKGMPPAVQNVVREKDSAAQPPEEPKRKVSRFKAARMGLE